MFLTFFPFLLSCLQLQPPSLFFFFFLFNSSPPSLTCCTLNSLSLFLFLHFLPKSNQLAWSQLESNVKLGPILLTSTVSPLWAFGCNYIWLHQSPKMPTKTTKTRYIIIIIHLFYFFFSLFIIFL